MPKLESAENVISGAEAVKVATSSREDPSHATATYVTSFANPSEYVRMFVHRKELGLFETHVGQPRLSLSNQIAFAFGLQVTSTYGGGIRLTLPEIVHENEARYLACIKSLALACPLRRSRDVAMHTKSKKPERDIVKFSSTITTNVLVVTSDDNDDDEY